MSMLVTFKPQMGTKYESCIKKTYSLKNQTFRS